MKAKIPIWVMVLALILIAGAGFVQDEYGAKPDCSKEKQRADSLQKVVDSFNTCYKWNNQKHEYGQ